MATTTRAIANGLLEFSKRITLGLLLLYGVQVVSSVAIIAFSPDVAEKITEFMRACTPVYITGLAGYSAKAGVENALKIINDAKQLTEEKKEEE